MGPRKVLPSRIKVLRPSATADENTILWRSRTSEADTSSCESSRRKVESEGFLSKSLPSSWLRPWRWRQENRSLPTGELLLLSASALREVVDGQDCNHQHPTPLQKPDPAAHAVVRLRLEKTDQIASRDVLGSEGLQGCSALSAHDTVIATFYQGLLEQTSLGSWISLPNCGWFRLACSS